MGVYNSISWIFDVLNRNLPQIGDQILCVIYSILKSLSGLLATYIHSHKCMSATLLIFMISIIMLNLDIVSCHSNNIITIRENFQHIHNTGNLKFHKRVILYPDGHICHIYVIFHVFICDIIACMHAKLLVCSKFLMNNFNTMLVFRICSIRP